MLGRRMFLGLATGWVASAQQVSYRTGIEAWRREREQNLVADDGWTTLVGLFWLEEGRPENTIVGGVSFLLRDGKVTARADAGAGVRLEGKPFREGTLRDDDPGPADVLTMGSKTLLAIERGGRVGIRVRDTESRYRKEFHGLQWYPVKEEYRVTGRLMPYAAEKTVPVPTVIPGLTQYLKSPGVVEFRLRGQRCRLEALIEDDELFFVFRDATTNKTTYPAGRFLYSAMPKAGQVELDFNKAYNPPCAFTPYATCPLPPRENRLTIAVEAGERNYAEHTASGKQ